MPTRVCFSSPSNINVERFSSSNFSSPWKWVKGQTVKGHRCFFPPLYLGSHGFKKYDSYRICLIPYFSVLSLDENIFNKFYIGITSKSLSLSICSGYLLLHKKSPQNLGTYHSNHLYIPHESPVWAGLGRPISAPCSIRWGVEGWWEKDSLRRCTHMASKWVLAMAFGWKGG